MKRALKIAAVTVAVLIVIPVLALILLAGTETGTRFAFERAAAYLPEGITVGQVEGRLSDRLLLRDIEVATDGLIVRLERADLHWTPSALWSGRLVIRQLEASGLRVELLPAEAEPAAPEPFELPGRIDLPVTVVLERAAVRDIWLAAAPDVEPIRIDSFEAEGGFADAHLDLRRLDLRSPLLDLQAAAGITMAGGYPVTGRLEWTLRPPDYPELRGTTQLDGALDALQIEQQIAPPYDVRAAATVSNLVDAAEPIRIAANADVQDFDPTVLRADLTPLLLAFSVRAEGPLDALELEAELTADGLEQGTVEATASVLLEPDAVLIRELHLTQPTHDGRLQTTGRVGFGDAVAGDLHVTWERMQWPLEGAATVSSPQGEVRFTGPPDDYRLSLTADVSVPEYPLATLELTGEGNLQEIALRLSAMTGPGRLEGQVELAWEPDLEARVQLAGEDMDLETVAADWPGRVSFELAADGRADGDVISVRIQRLAADGEVREQALALEARGAYRQDPGAVAAHVLEIEELNLVLGNTLLEADGRVADAADLRWRLNAPDLSNLLDGAQGRVSGSGTITGALPLPRIEARFEGAGLGYEDYELEQIEISAHVDPAGDGPSSLGLDARDGRLAGVVLERLQIQGSGTPADHRLAVQLRSSEGNADLDLEGRLTEPLDADSSWYFRLTDARLAPPGLAPWELNEPAEGQLALEAASVARHCWVSGDARLCVAGGRTATRLDVDFDLSDLAFAYLAAFLPQDYEVSGAVSAAGSLRQEDGEPLSGELELTTTAGEIAVSADATASASPSATRLRLEPSHARLTLLAHEAVADVDFSMEHGHARLNARLAGPDDAQADTPLTERPLSGTLSIDVPDIAFVADFLPDLAEVAGAIGGDLDLAGTLAIPVLTGRIALRDGFAQVPAAGVTLTDVAVDVEGRGGDSVGLSASATSGGGTVTLNGELAVLSDVPTASLRLVGESFQVANTRDARLFVTPDLEITAGAERIDIVGEVRVPRAELTPVTGGPAEAVTASADQILLSDDADQNGEPETIRELHTRVRIVLGDSVSFDGYGLTARFVGSVLAVQAPGAPVTATGELNILDGEYRAYGQGLVIETGNIYFAGGPLTEPALDIRAVRRPQPGIMVGAHVVGTLEEPRFTLFSEPPMSQQEQLSYLVLGRSLQEAPSGESSALSQAALSMGLRGGDFLARNIGERIGVDQLAIETGSGEAGAASDPSQAALVAGKYLSPRLYVSYGIGLFDPVNVLRIQYTIADSWRIVTQSSSESTGADIIYTIERGR